jgi:hypothetical protein
MCLLSREAAALDFPSCRRDCSEPALCSRPEARSSVLIPTDTRPRTTATRRLFEPATALLKHVEARECTARTVDLTGYGALPYRCLSIIGISPAGQQSDAQSGREGLHRVQRRNLELWRAEVGSGRKGIQFPHAYRRGGPARRSSPLRRRHVRFPRCARVTAIECRDID